MGVQRPLDDDVLPQPSTDAEDGDASEPLTAKPARRLLGGVAMVWFGVALLGCVVLFVVWLAFQ